MYLYRGIACVWALVGLFAVGPTELVAQDRDAQLERSQDRGQQLFAAHCARCHGLAGNGGEGPSLLGRRFERAAEQSDLVRIVLDGIPGTAMSRTWVDESEAADIAAYVWTLARVAEGPIPGDAESGRRLFEGSAGCSECHIVNGKGVGLGPDMSDIGARRGLPFLRESILLPGSSIPQGPISLHSSFLVVSVVMKDGTELRGMRVTEDAFALNLRDRRGRYHSINKSQIASLDRETGASLMPDYRERLTEDQVTNIVAYMASLRGRR